jgi:hypothetical protein
MQWTDCNGLAGGDPFRHSRTAASISATLPILAKEFGLSAAQATKFVTAKEQYADPEWVLQCQKTGEIEELGAQVTHFVNQHVAKSAAERWAQKWDGQAETYYYWDRTSSQPVATWEVPEEVAECSKLLGPNWLLRWAAQTGSLAREASGDVTVPAPPPAPLKSKQIGRSLSARGHDNPAPSSPSRSPTRAQTPAKTISPDAAPGLVPPLSPAATRFRAELSSATASSGRKKAVERSDRARQRWAKYGRMPLELLKAELATTELELQDKVDRALLARKMVQLLITHRQIVVLIISLVLHYLEATKLNGCTRRSPMRRKPRLWRRRNYLTCSTPARAATWWTSTATRSRAPTRR